MALRMSAIFFLAVLVGTGYTGRIRNNFGDMVLQDLEATTTTTTTTTVTTTTTTTTTIQVAAAIGGQLNRDGCYFQADPANPDFQIRAVLTWNSVVKDLDLWMTKVECSENTRKRYKCFNFFDPEKIAAKENGNHDFDNSCQRSEFSTLHNKFGTRNIESQTCRMMMCDVENGRATKEDENGKPVCGQFDPHYTNKTDNSPTSPLMGISNNQFAKWVTWTSRYMDKLHEKFDINSGELVIAEGAHGWTENNYAYMNVDATEGYGPETITVVNPPPGTYQFVVNQFSNHPNSIFDRDTLKSAAATIKVRISAGESRAEFKCKIEPECPDRSYVWNALHVKIERMGEMERGMEKFKVRIIDSKDKMTRIASDQLPTGNKAANVIRWVSKEEIHDGPMARLARMKNGSKFPIIESYFQPSAGNDGQPYADDDLDTLCHGTCEVAATTPGFESCLRDD